MARAKRVSSLSLSDQWASSGALSARNSHKDLTQLSSNKSGTNLRGSFSNLSIHGGGPGVHGGGSRRASSTSRRGSVIRTKKTIIDHQRVASYAFAFDIDGVIVRGPETIPEARDALKMLNGENKYNIKVPYIFITNGGGKSEATRCKDLSNRLGIEVREDQVIQGHTPMKDLITVYKNVLVVGGVGDTCRKIAQGYGFQNVFIPLDVMKWNPSVSPYYQLTKEDEECVRNDVDFANTPIDAILVFADSRNWAADQQIILELLLSKNGVMGTISETFDEGPPIYFAHSDFVWATDYKLSRYGMGALQVSIAALYQEHTGKELKVTRFGKPQRGTFRYANKVLGKWRRDVLDKHFETNEAGELVEVPIEEEDEEEEEEQQQQQSAPTKKGPFQDSDSESDSEDEDEPLNIQSLNQLTLDLPPASTVYFVGDTPESDIRFANSHDESWHSILVKTGVYKDGAIPKYKPKHICDNVLEAVKYAIEREHQFELKEWNENAIEVPVVEENYKIVDDAKTKEDDFKKNKDEDLNLNSNSKPKATFGL